MISIAQTTHALDLGLIASFAASGGTEPYSWEVLPDGAGGSIDSDGFYTAPSVYPDTAKKRFATIKVTDADAVSAQAQIGIGPPLFLFMDVLKQEMALPWDRIVQWDQKLFQPTDAGLYIAVSVMREKPFGNVKRAVSDGSGMLNEAFVVSTATLGIELISRGPEARDRRLDVLLALGSDYAGLQQNRNSFYFGRLPAMGEFVNLSQVDGAAIPYRFHIAFNMQYAYRKNTPSLYFTDFEREVYTNP